jgi:hypothetical protein
VGGAGSAAAEVEPEPEEEPILTSSRRNTRALSTESPLGQHSAASRHQRSPSTTHSTKFLPLTAAIAISMSRRSEAGVVGAAAAGRRRGSGESLLDSASARRRGQGRGRGCGHVTDSLSVRGEIILGDNDSGEEDSEPEAESKQEEEPGPGEPDHMERNREKAAGPQHRHIHLQQTPTPPSYLQAPHMHEVVFSTFYCEQFSYRLVGDNWWR